MKFGIGQPLRRLEDSKFLTGNGTYNDDIDFKDQLYMHLVRSPFAHAKIININYQNIKEMDGVVEVFCNNKIKNMKVFDSFLTHLNPTI